MRRLAVLLSCLTLVACAASSPDVPWPAPATDTDEFQISSTVIALYNVVSGPAGRRDWRQFEGLFAPGGEIIVSGETDGAPSATLMTTKEYVDRSTPTFNEKGWFERPMSMRIERYGNIAHVWSMYEGRAAANDEKPMVRGVNSFTMVRIGTAWKVQSVMWQAEDAAHPIPPQFYPTR